MKFSDIRPGDWFIFQGPDGDETAVKVRLLNTHNAVDPYQGLPLWFDRQQPVIRITPPAHPLCHLTHHPRVERKPT